MKTHGNDARPATTSADTSSTAQTPRGVGIHFAELTHTSEGGASTEMVYSKEKVPLHQKLRSNENKNKTRRRTARWKGRTTRGHQRGTNKIATHARPPAGGASGGKGQASKQESGPEERRPSSPSAPPANQRRVLVPLVV